MKPNSSSTSPLRVNNLHCEYRGEAAVAGVSFDVRRGQVACLLGPSGCGKTTILRAIAGLEPVTSGLIELRGEPVSTSKRSVATEKRRLGMVTQDYALFPHRNVINNVTFGLRGKEYRWNSAKRRSAAMDALEQVEMQGYAERYPHELSGGQQQRVALARSLATKPDILLLDEPFSSLDLDLRARLGTRLHDLLRAHDITGLVVTHDQHEAFALADQIGVMRDGKILQWDTPYRIYHEPADRYVADFVGQGSLIPGLLRDKRTVETALGVITGSRDINATKGAMVEVLLRPDDLHPDAAGSIVGNVVKAAFRGADILYTIRLANGSEVLSAFPSHNNPEIGEVVHLSLDAEHLVAFPVSTNA